MAKQHSIHLFTGKIGNLVVGRKGVDGDYIEGIYQPRVNQPNSEAQQQQKSKFALVTKFISAVNGFIKVGYKNSKKKYCSTFASAVSENIKLMITGVWPSYSLDFTKAVLAKGNVDLPYNPSASLTATDLDLTWTDNSGLGNALSTDMVMVCAYNTSKKQAVYATDLAARNARTASFSLPTTWTGDTVQVYLAAHRATGNDCSNSVYLGSYTI